MHSILISFFSALLALLSMGDVFPNPIGEQFVIKLALVARQNNFAFRLGKCLEKQAMVILGHFELVRFG